MNFFAHHTVITLTFATDVTDHDWSDETGICRKCGAIEGTAKTRTVCNRGR